MRSVADPKLLTSNPDPDPDPTCQVITDPDPDPSCKDSTDRDPDIIRIFFVKFLQDF